MHIHNIIKIMYVNMGFLPDHPYYLISDDEMFDAFLGDDGFFATYYPCPDEEFREAYNKLLNYIIECINDYKQEGTDVPDWVYSYMIMCPTTFASPEEDVAYICEMANIDTPAILAEFNTEVASTCYKVSKKWLQKIPSRTNNRPPTMFGEAHVIKSLRLMQANVLLDSDFWENA